jgi:hypothetical protein
MRRALLLLVLLSMLLALGQCGRTGTSTGILPSSTEGVLGQNLLVKVSGALAYKHPGWNDYLPLTFGIALVRGDLLEVAPDGEGLLVCADLSLAPLEAGYLGGLPCPERNPVLTRGDSLVVAPQRGVAAGGSIPLLLQPRHTFVRDANPLVRWTPSDTADTLYTVRVWGSDVDWQTQTAAVEIRYPEEAPPLTAGISYWITIADDSGRSSDQEATALDLGFVLLTADQIAAVDSLLRQAQALNLDEQGSRLVEAEILVSRRLRADALVALTDLATRDGAPTVQQRLGEQYLEIGLYAQAQSACEAALAGFRNLGNRAGEAAALTVLGLAHRGDNDEAAARESLEQARELYQDLGDVDGARHVEQVLQDLGGK